MSAHLILGFVYSYSYEELAFAFKAHLILVKLRGLAGGGYERFFDFAATHPSVLRISRMIGEWDLEIEVQLEHPGELDELIHQLYNVGGGLVKELLPHTWGPEYHRRDAKAQRVLKVTD